MSDELERLGWAGGSGISPISEVFDCLAAIEKRLDDKADKKICNENVQRDIEAHRDIGKRLDELSSSVDVLQNWCIEHDGRLKNLSKRVSKLECPSPMFLDAMERLHALDGKGNGDVDPPEVVTLSRRVDRLEEWMRLEIEVAVRKGKKMREEASKPKPPAVCEGCAEIGETCGTCKYLLAHPLAGAPFGHSGNMFYPDNNCWRIHGGRSAYSPSPGTPACEKYEPNHKPLKGEK